jgi:UDP-N-acetylmuramoyl-tripeptide--D-alanyl-D-alanine ligase
VDTVERVAEAKSELLAALPAGGAAVVPAGARLLAPYLRSDVATTTFGAGGDMSLAAFVPGERDSTLVADVHGQRLDLRVNVTSRHNAENALAALGAYLALGLPLERVQAGALDIVLSRWREEEHALPGDVLLLNDCYNANPLSMHAALVHLRDRGAGRRLVAVLGGMAELGPDSPAYHREIGEAAERAGVDVLVAVGVLAGGYLAGAAGVTDRRHVADADAALAEIRDLLAPGDCVLVKGSRTFGLEAVAEALLSVPA